MTENAREERNENLNPEFNLESLELDASEREVVASLVRRLQNSHGERAEPEAEPQTEPLATWALDPDARHEALLLLHQQLENKPFEL